MAGRTNKLVDGCYSHWAGACWPLIEACLNGADDGLARPARPARLDGLGPPTGRSEGESESEGQGLEAATTGPKRLPPAKQSLFSREGLIRYILCCCQDESKRGGLRDKPTMYVDFTEFRFPSLLSLPPFLGSRFFGFPFW